MLNLYYFKMIAIISLVLLATVATSTDVNPSRSTRTLFGVDSNKLSCDTYGLIHLLLPHYTDCNKFYKCVHGREIEYVCPLPLVFDFVLQVCNWDFIAGCTLRDADVEGSGDYDEGTVEFAGSLSADVEIETPLKVADGFKVPLICEDADYANMRVPHKDDCQHYWRCSEGKVSSFACMEGLFFNAKTQQCDYEANVVCHVN